MALSANQFFSWLCSLFSTSFCNFAELSAFLELFLASFSAYPAGGSGNIPGGSVQGNKTVRGLRFSAILSWDIKDPNDTMKLNCVNDVLSWFDDACKNLSYGLVVGDDAIYPWR